MGRYTGKTCRLLCMLSLTASFFLVEITVGYITNSLALVGDSYHMLSDVVALLVGFASVRISKWQSEKNTYGWARAEVLGALVNSVFLIALCFTIFVEALQRLFHNEHIHDPNLMLIVGGLGLLINLIGLALFSGHAHSHGGGGHGHSHGGSSDHSHSGHSHVSRAEEERQRLSRTNSAAQVSSNGRLPGEHSESSDMEEIAIDGVAISNTLQSSSQLNMRGVFLHVLGDALGSVIVIISALIIKFVQHDWKFKVDPAMSMVMVIIILSTTIPLLKESALILLQTVPTHIQVQDLQKELIAKVEGVMAVHEFHVWQLAGNRIIASAHIRCQNLRDYMRIAEEVKNFFHNKGIHSTTIQPEFTEYVELEAQRECALECGPDKQCYIDTCCAIKSKKSSPGMDNLVETEGIRQRVSVGNTGGTGDGCAAPGSESPSSVSVSACVPEHSENTHC